MLYQFWVLRVGQVLVSAFAPCRFVLSAMALGAPPAAKRALATIIVAVAAVYKVALPLTRDSAPPATKRALATIIAAVAAVYKVALALPLTRDSADEVVLESFTQVITFENSS